MECLLETVGPGFDLYRKGELALAFLVVVLVIIAYICILGFSFRQVFTRGLPTRLGRGRKTARQKGKIKSATKTNRAAGLS
jgi:hypothetical protein